MTKQTHVTLRVTAAEATKIETDAGAAGMSVSAYVRMAMRDRGNLEQLAAALARDLAAELRSDFQAQATDVDEKLKLISDQIAALSMIIKENRK